MNFQGPGTDSAADHAPQERALSVDPARVGEAAGERKPAPTDWFDPSQPVRAPDPPDPFAALPSWDTIQKVVGVHAAALIAAAATGWPGWLGSGVPEVLVGSLAVSQVALLTLWLACGPPPFGLRLAFVAACGCITGAVASTYQHRSSSVAEMAVAGFLLYPWTCGWFAIYLTVGLTFTDTEMNFRRREELSEPRAPRPVQFTLFALCRWTVAAAGMLGLGRFVAHDPMLAWTLFGLMFAVWGAATGLVVMREPILPLPIFWKLLSLLTGAFACGAAMRFSAWGLANCVPVAVGVISIVGTLALLRSLGYRVQLTTLDRQLRDLRRKVLSRNEAKLDWLKDRPTAGEGQGPAS